ncbi:MAG: DUF4845 domain-containing protein [Steroidobacteraceae bacterium]
MNQLMRRRQQGMTFIGLMFILVFVGAVGYGVVRLIPVYLNYMKLVRTMESSVTESKGDSASIDAIRNSISRHWDIEDITGVNQKDIEITRDDGGLTLHVAYDDSVPYIGNLSLTAHFDKTVKGQ